MRRQDIYDLHLLINSRTDSHNINVRDQILGSLKEKSTSRHLSIERNSMRNPEISRRSREKYRSLEPEIDGPLPDFDELYEFVRAYYEDLPWD